MFVLGKCFPSTLNIWMAGCTLWLRTHVSEDWERRRDVYLWLCWNDEKHAGISFCWRVTAEEQPKKSCIRFLLVLHDCCSAELEELHGKCQGEVSHRGRPGACWRIPTSDQSGRNVNIHRPARFTIGEIPLGWGQKWNWRSTVCWPQNKNRRAPKACGAATRAKHHKYVEQERTATRL